MNRAELEGRAAANPGMPAGHWLRPASPSGLCMSALSSTAPPLPLEPRPDGVLAAKSRFWAACLSARHPLFLNFAFSPQVRGLLGFPVAWAESRPEEARAAWKFQRSMDFQRATVRYVPHVTYNLCSVRIRKTVPASLSVDGRRNPRT